MSERPPKIEIANDNFSKEQQMRQFFATLSDGQLLELLQDDEHDQWHDQIQSEFERRKWMLANDNEQDGSPAEMTLEYVAHLSDSELITKLHSERSKEKQYGKMLKAVQIEAVKRGLIQD